MINIKNKIILPSLVGIAAFTGIASGSALTSASASAATPMKSSTVRSSHADVDRPTGRRNLDQVIVLGDTATKVQAAAQVAVTTGTVGSNPTAAASAVYETHVKKSDGTVVSVKLDAEFNALSIDTMAKPQVSGPKDLN